MSNGQPVPPPPLRRVLSGTDAIKEAHEMQRRNLRLEMWPYDWIFPPDDSERVHVEGSVDVSTLIIGTTVEVVEYQVQNNYKFYLNGLVQLYIGPNTFIPGDGQITWFLDVNTPLGSTALQGYPVQGYDRSGVPKGGFATGVFAPYHLGPRPELLAPLDILRSKVVINTGNINTGRMLTMFDGWLLPV